MVLLPSGNMTAGVSSGRPRSRIAVWTQSTGPAYVPHGRPSTGKGESGDRGGDSCGEEGFQAGRRILSVGAGVRGADGDGSTGSAGEGVRGGGGAGEGDLGGGGAGEGDRGGGGEGSTGGANARVVGGGGFRPGHGVPTCGRNDWFGAKWDEPGAVSKSGGQKGCI